LPLFSKSEIPYQSGQVRLRSGDLLIIFADGVVEAVNEAGQEYGESRLVPALEAAPPETATETMKRVMTDVNQFASFARQHDDITCLVLRVST
jgi:sigma-B regulation protein RsbU (phosphoserine phosphatase)